MKKCNKCQNIKEYQYYFKDKSKKDGYHTICKDCTKISKIKNCDGVKLIIENKKCSICKLLLHVNNFTKLKYSKDGYNNFCKSCRKQTDKLRKELNKIPLKIENFQKLCEKCSLYKNSSEFRINKKSNDNIFSICNQCWPETTWTKEKQKVSEKKYIKNNPEKIKEKWKKQGKNINRRIRDSLNHRISDSLKSNRTNKNNKTHEYIGCKIKFLKLWIEYQFTDDMNWENYGKWELDHVTPCSSFDLKDIKQQLICFNWKNIQPLWKYDNIQKSNNIDIDLINSHLDKITYFLAQVKDGELTGTS